MFYALVSGATGFMAHHVINISLQKDYKVIGTARSQEKCDRVIKQFNDHPNLILEVVEDFSSLNAFGRVFQKYNTHIKIVLHTASPFFFDTKEYLKDLLVPAMNGTLSILNAIKKYSSSMLKLKIN